MRNNEDILHEPIDYPADDQVGQDTERNYRYQHAYGVILLIGAVNKKLPYRSIYAEHHEDFICERTDNTVDGYQIKTRKPEEGSWDVGDEALKRSIKRFVTLDKKFPGRFASFNFVSNAGFSSPDLNLNDQKKLRKSPVRFLEIIKGCTLMDDIRSPYDVTLNELCEYCECAPEELIALLKKMELIKGPDRDSFDSEIVTTHLAVIPICSAYSVSLLNAIRDELIHQVWLASHRVEDPSKHWYPINKKASNNPHITAKRIPVDIVLQTIQDKGEPPFRYFNNPTLVLGSGKGNLYTLRKKMQRAGLHDQVVTMERRSLSAEQRLIEFAIQNPKDTESHLAQLESVVQGECDEAYLAASLTSEPKGSKMLSDVYNRLRIKAEKQSDLVLRQPYELLIGIAGLLTGECKVWWSERFNLEGEE